MFLVWTGRGYVIFIVFAASLVVSWPLVPMIAPMIGLNGELTGETSTLDPRFFLLVALAAAISAGVCYPIGRTVLKQPEPYVLLDPSTGRHHAVNLDTLYRIDTRYWTFIFGAMALLFAILTLFVR